MNITRLVQEAVVHAAKQLYSTETEAAQLPLTPTRKEFEGDYTVVVFPLTKAAKKKPEEIAEDLGNYLVDSVAEIESYNVIKGFLNLSLSEQYWRTFLLEEALLPDFGQHASRGEKVMVEYSSPNTNKPLHLGHVRNILLGWSCSKILEAAGYDVVRVQVINDRGIAICKSMLAWQKYGNGATPESAGVKGDHFVGKYYVEFEQRINEEFRAWQQTPEAETVYKAHGKEGQDRTDFFKEIAKTHYFNEYSQLGREAKDMLLRWEAGDMDTLHLWKTMNGWVYQGFDNTYHKLGVRFDKLYFESDTYLLGKDAVEKGLQRGVFYQEPDGSVWADLEDVKLGKKVVLRSDGTSMYITQDIGTAQIRFRDFGARRMVYVVADEQNYHFQVLFELLKRLGEPFAEGLYHLSYGMVELPDGKMKSREGKVVDADDLIEEVIDEARNHAKDRGEGEELPPDTFEKIGLAALKYHILKVQPRKWMVFDPAESVDLVGQTGPYIQYACVRIGGILRRAEREGVDFSRSTQHQRMEPQERELLQLLHRFPEIISEAADGYDPSHLASYCYGLAKAYSKFWSEVSVFNADSEAAKAFRLHLSQAVGQVLKNGLDLLGIEVPERM
jgi:arginyl-tRNA synthetase